MVTTIGKFVEAVQGNLKPGSCVHNIRRRLSYEGVIKSKKRGNHSDPVSIDDAAIIIVAAVLPANIRDRAGGHREFMMSDNGQNAIRLTKSALGAGCALTIEYDAEGAIKRRTEVKAKAMKALGSLLSCQEEA